MKKKKCQKKKRWQNVFFYSPIKVTLLFFFFIFCQMHFASFARVKISRSTRTPLSISTVPAPGRGEYELPVNVRRTSAAVISGSHVML